MTKTFETSKNRKGLIIIKTQSCHKPAICNYHSVKSSQPVGEDKYAVVHRLKEFLYSLFHALPINSIHKPLISNKIEFIAKVLILSLFFVEMFDS